jgi:hypothetical protein
MTTTPPSSGEKVRVTSASTAAEPSLQPGTTAGVVLFPHSAPYPFRPATRQVRLSITSEAITLLRESVPVTSIPVGGPGGVVDAIAVKYSADDNLPIPESPTAITLSSPGWLIFRDVAGDPVAHLVIGHWIPGPSGAAEIDEGMHRSGLVEALTAAGLPWQEMKPAALTEQYCDEVGRSTWIGAFPPADPPGYTPRKLLFLVPASITTLVYLAHRTTTVLAILALLTLPMTLIDSRILLHRWLLDRRTRRGRTLLRPARRRWRTLTQRVARHDDTLIITDHTANEQQYPLPPVRPITPNQKTPAATTLNTLALVRAETKYLTDRFNGSVFEGRHPSILPGTYLEFRAQDGTCVLSLPTRTWLGRNPTSPDACLRLRTLAEDLGLHFDPHVTEPQRPPAFREARFYMPLVTRIEAQAPALLGQFLGLVGTKPPTWLAALIVFNVTCTVLPLVLRILKPQPVPLWRL